MRVVRVALFGLLAVGNMATIGNGCGPSLPENDTCAQPETAGVSSLRFVSLLGSGATAPDMQTQNLIFGPQGGSMVELRFALEGADVPSCASFVLTAERCLNLDCTELEDSEVFPTTPALQTYAEGQGRNTRSYLLQIPYRFDAGTLVQIRAEVGTASSTLRMWLEQEGELFDAGPRDAGPADARPDAMTPDAMPGVPDAVP